VIVVLLLHERIIFMTLHRRNRKYYNTVSMDEKRMAPRFKINQLIGYFPNREEYLWAEGLDLSRGGVSCTTAAPIDPLTNVYLMLEVPVTGSANPGEKRMIRCEGFVAHSEMVDGKCKFGVRISRVSEEDQPYLEAYYAMLETELKSS
jgi:hypothetical protein